MSANEIGPGPDAVWLAEPQKAVAEIRRLEARVAELHDALVFLRDGCHGCSACAAMARALGAEASATAAEIGTQGGKNRG